eukprot:64373-Amorphochlora_amoeboformis.AAC.1
MKSTIPVLYSNPFYNLSGSSRGNSGGSLFGSSRSTPTPNPTLTPTLPSSKAPFPTSGEAEDLEAPRDSVVVVVMAGVE